MELNCFNFGYTIKKLHKEIREFLDSEKEELESIVINVEDYQRLGKTTFIYTQLLPFLFFDNNNKSNREDPKISILDKYYLDIIAVLFIELLRAKNNYLGETEKFEIFHAKKELYNNTIDELEKQGCVLVNINGIDLFNFFINAYKAYQNQITKYHISVAMFVATLRIIISKIRSKLSPNCKIKKLENKVINIAKEFHIVSNVFYLSNEKSFSFKSYIGFRNTTGQKYELNPLFFISDVMIELDKVWRELIEILKMKKLLLVLVFEDLERFTLKPDKENNQEFLEIVGNYLVLVKRYLLDPKSKNIVSIFEIPKEYSEYFSAKHYNIFNKIENSFPRDTITIDMNIYFAQLLRDCIIYLNYLDLYYYLKYNTSIINIENLTENASILLNLNFRNLKTDLKNVMFSKEFFSLIFENNNKTTNIHKISASSFFEYIENIRMVPTFYERYGNMEIKLSYYDVFFYYLKIFNLIFENYRKEKFLHIIKCLNVKYSIFEVFDPEIKKCFLTNLDNVNSNNNIFKNYKFLVFPYIIASTDIYIIQTLLYYIYKNSKNIIELLKILLMNKIYEYPISFLLSIYTFLSEKIKSYPISFEYFVNLLENIKTRKKILKININSDFEPDITLQIDDDLLFILFESLIKNIYFLVISTDKKFTEKETTIIKELLLSIKDLPEFMKNKINDLKEIKYSQLLCILAYIGFVKYIKHQHHYHVKIKSFYYYLNENKLEDITIKELKETIEQLQSIETKEELINYLKNNKNLNKVLLKDLKYLLLYLVKS